MWLAFCFVCVCVFVYFVLFLFVCLFVCLIVCLFFGGGGEGGSCHSSPLSVHADWVSLFLQSGCMVAFCCEFVV